MKQIIAICSALVLLGGHASADWPQFRGPRGAALAPNAGLPVEWSADTNLRWKVALPGPGCSSLIVFGEHVYVTCYTGYGVNPRAPGNRADLQRHLVCVERGSGKILWSYASRAKADAEDSYHSAVGFAAHTPVADERGVYAYFGSDGAACFSHAGERLWHAPCGPKGRRRESSAGSMILHGELLIFNDDHPFHQGDTLALDRRTGREVWRQAISGGYVSPLLVDVAGRTELVIGTMKFRYLGLDPASGKEHWHSDGPIYAASPSAHEGIVYVTGGDKRTAIKAGGQGNVTYTHQLWQAAGGVIVSSPVHYQGHLYWCSDRGDLVFCADARDGRIVSRERLPDGTRDRQIYASPIVADGRLIFVSRENGACVLDASPKLTLLAHNRLAGDDSVFNGTPAVSHGCLYLRSDRYLYCIGARAP